MDYIYRIQEINALFEAADYIGVQTIEAEDSLERFLIKIFLRKLNDQSLILVD